MEFQIAALFWISVHSALTVCPTKQAFIFYMFCSVVTFFLGYCTFSVTISTSFCGVLYMKVFISCLF